MKETCLTKLNRIIKELRKWVIKLYGNDHFINHILPLLPILLEILFHLFWIWKYHQLCIWENLLFEIIEDDFFCWAQCFHPCLNPMMVREQVQNFLRIRNSFSRQRCPMLDWSWARLLCWPCSSTSLCWRNQPAFYFFISCHFICNNAQSKSSLVCRPNL